MEHCGYTGKGGSKRGWIIEPDQAGLEAVRVSELAHRLASPCEDWTEPTLDTPGHDEPAGVPRGAVDQRLSHQPPSGFGQLPLPFQVAASMIDQR